MKKNDVKASKYLLVLLMTCAIFIAGVLLGNYFTEQKFQKLSDIESNLQLQTQGAELQYQLMLQQPCKYINSTPLAEELYQISEKLDYMESQRGENDPDVLQLKKSYSLLELRHWIFVQKTNEACGTATLPVFYFYSNEGDCDRCKEQGYALTYIRKKYPDVRVYAFDVNLDNPALQMIKSIHGVDSTPTIVIDEQKYSFLTVEELEGILDGLGQEPSPEYQ